jgi:hypothetical protein
MPPHHWRTRASDLRKLAAATDDGPTKTCMGVVEAEYERLARNSTRWQVGNRVSRRDGSELGTIEEADDKAKIRIKWDGGQTSYFRRDRRASVKLLGPEL